MQMREKIAHRPGLIKIIDSLCWLLFDKFIRLVGGLAVGVWVARYLGPEQFGLLNYALAFVALFTALSTLGLNSIVVRDLVHDSSSEGRVLGTAFVLQIVGSLLALLLMVILIQVLRDDNVLIKWMVVLLGSAMVVRSIDVVRFWFEAKVVSRYLVWSDNLAFVTCSLIKVLLITNNAPLIAFVWVSAAETVLASLIVFLTYQKVHDSSFKWNFDYEICKSLLKDSWPLMLSGLAVSLYMKIDQVMLGYMSGDLDVGVFSAAAKISEIFYFLPMIIATTVFPSILMSRKNNSVLYEIRTVHLFRLMVFLGLLITIPISFFSSEIIGFIYGQEYFKSGEVLAIHALATVFVFLGVVSGRWFIAEGLQKLSLYRTMLAALVNVLLNLYLIPRHGAIGAAWATLGAQVMAGFVFNAFGKRSRYLFRLQMRAIRTPLKLFTRKIYA